MAASKKDKLPGVHEDLKGFNIWIDELGQIRRTHSVDDLNRFLNQHVVDKRLKDRFGYKSDDGDDTVRFLYKDGENT